MTDYLPEGLFRGRNTHYFIPAKKYRRDYKYNIFRDYISGLKSDWNSEYKEVFKSIKTPEQVYDEVRTHLLTVTSRPADFIEEIEGEAMIIATRRIQKYDEIKNSLYFQFIQKVAAEITRYMLIVCKELGYEGKDFNINIFFKFSNSLIKGNKKPRINGFKKYNTFNMLNKINNFLKHNSVKAYEALYEALKKSYSRNVKLKDSKGNKYENGMYAGNWIIIKPKYIDNLFDELIIFFRQYCEIILEENIEEADWNYDEYFKEAFKLLKDPSKYYGV